MATIQEELDRAMQTCESASLYFEQQSRIFAWTGLRAAQRIAALVIHAAAVETGLNPTPTELAALLGISPERAEAVFDGIEHPPFALTRVGDSTPRFEPSQTLEYGAG